MWPINGKGNNGTDTGEEQDGGERLQWNLPKKRPSLEIPRDGD
jgi:hypothetical protein